MKKLITTIGLTTLLASSIYAKGTFGESPTLSACKNAFQKINLDLTKIKKLEHVFNNCDKAKAVTYTTSEVLVDKPNTKSLVLNIVYSDIQMINHIVIHDENKKELTVYDNFITNKSTSDVINEVNQKKKDKTWEVGLETTTMLTMRKKDYTDSKIINLNNDTSSGNIIDQNLYKINLKGE
jgi:hypothetical protein